MMTSTVPLDDKKVFVKWFLKHYQLKRREGVWILNYLLSNDELLDNIHFVEDAHYCPRAIVMSTIDDQGIPFRFYKDAVMTTDAEKSFHELRLNPDLPMYIQLNFPSIPPTIQYLAVLENNPYIPRDAFVSASDRQITEQVIEKSLIEFQQQQVLALIDEALDAGDKQRFIELTKQLQALKHTVGN